MSLQERLLSDMKEAMRSRKDGKLRLTVIRMVRASIKNAEIKQQRNLSDEEVLEVVAGEVKQRRDAMLEYVKADRQDVVQSLQEEIEILMAYLPEQLTTSEISKLVEEAIERTGANSLRDLGKVMGQLMPKVKGRADGKLVNKIVREMLSSE